MVAKIRNCAAWPDAAAHGGTAAFQAGDAFLQHRDGRIGQARVDVAEIVQVEERRGVIDIVENISRGLVDRRDARAGGGIGCGARVDGARLEAVADIGRRFRARLRLAFGGRLGRAVADDAGVDAAPRQFAAQAAVLDLRAAVHDHFDAGGLRAGRGFVVADAELHPHHLGADRDRVVDDRAGLIGGAEDVDHVDRVRDVAQRGIDLLALQFLPRGCRGSPG